MIASVTATVFNLALNYVFIKKFGYIAAAYTTIFCYIMQAIIDFIAMRKVVGESIYNMKHICFLSSAVLMISMTCNLLYSRRIFRYVIILLLIISAFFLKNKIVSLFKSFKEAKE